MMRRAELSPCGRYRYALYRTWDGTLPGVTFVMLNPSTADAERDDATVRRCVDYARRWGYGGIVVVNLFALRATDPAELTLRYNPTGPLNRDYLYSLTCRPEGPVVAAWGAHRLAAGKLAYYQDRGLLRSELSCLAVTASGAPRHPLRLPAALTPQPWPVTS